MNDGSSPDPVELLLQTDDPNERQRLLRSATDNSGLYDALMQRARFGVVSAAPEARAAARAAAEVAALQGDPRSEAASLRVEGQALRVAGRHEDALTALEAAADAARRAGDEVLGAQVRIGQIDSLGWLGRVKEAGALADHLENELLRLGAEAEAAKVVVNRGNLAFRRDEYAEALQAYERAGDMLERSGEQVAVARVQANRANILTQLNRIDEALDLFHQAGETFAAAGMTQEVAMGEGNIGYLEFLSGRLTAALSAFQRARQAFEERHQEIEVAKADLDMGDIHRVLNLIPEALDHYDRAIGVFEKRALPYERARAQTGRGAALAALDRIDDALAALAEADRDFGAQKNPLQRAHVALLRAGLMAQGGMDREAQTEALSAERVFRRYRLPGWAAEARFIRARIDVERDLDPDGPAVATPGDSPLLRMAAIARSARKYSRGWLECRAEESLARWHRAHGATGRALRHYRRGAAALEAVRTQVVPEEMHVAFLRDKLGVYDGLISLLLSRGRPRDVREALEQVERARSRLLLERLEMALGGRLEGGQSGNPAEQALRSRINRLRAELNRAYHQVHSFDDRAPQRLIDRPVGESLIAHRLRAIEEEYRRALREWELAHGQVERNPSDAATIEELQAGLDPDETLLEFYAGLEEISVFLLTRQETRICRHVAPVEVVAQAARRLRYHLQRVALAPDYAGRHTTALHAGIHEITACLYETLWRPIERAVRTEKVTIVPHGLLHGLPFHAFGNSSEAVLDRWEVAYAPSAAFRLAARHHSVSAPDSTGAGALLVGVPAPGIEQVGSEIDALCKILPKPSVLRGGDATLAGFRREAPGCRILHLATHAFYRADNALFSGLRFADGWLLARDLYDIRLNCSLATLSACQTGVTHVAPGDEIFGLLRGFLAAGARSVAASYWPADDAATTELMTTFYSGVMNGLTRAAALRKAQWAIRRDRPHPYYWAAFALTGER